MNDNANKPGMLGRLFGRGESKTTPDDTSRPEAKDTDELVAQAETSSAADPAPDQPEGRKSWFERLKAGLSKTSSSLTDGIASVFTKRKLDAASLDELEDLLIQADLGVDTTMRITDRISDGKYEKGISPDEVREILASEVESVLAPVAQPLVIE